MLLSLLQLLALDLTIDLAHELDLVLTNLALLLPFPPLLLLLPIPLP